jgi:hypothetical protein
MISTGVIAQQLLILPHHPTNPTPLPFTVSHVLLMSTRSVVIEDPSVGLQYKTQVTSDPRLSRPSTNVEKLAVARRIIEATLDPEWLANNRMRFDELFRKAISG